MKKVEKSGGASAEKEEILVEKLNRVGKRGGHTTPVIPFWRLQQQQKQQRGAKHSIIQETPFDISSVSARKLAATLWEFHHYNCYPLSKMHHQGSGNGDLPRLRRLHHHQNNHQQHRYRSNGYEDSRAGVLGQFDPSPSSPDLAESASSLRRHLVASLMQHHRAIDRSNHAIQPVSPVSHGSSMEIAPYNPAVTPTSSVDFKRRIGESSYSLKTSSELLKVLNRIWSLEEQHVFNMSLVKALKKELDHARIRIRDLTRDQQTNRREIDEMMKQITEDKLIRKNKEQERISSAVQSVRDELEDERKLRKRSESLHRKLAREIYEVKTSLVMSVKELEKERMSREHLEDLCDEFAWGIKDYEQELHTLRQKYDKDWAERNDHDRLILHVSELWLDERMQMKHEGQNNIAEKNSVLEKLTSEIETFLLIKQKGQGKNNGHVVPRNRKFRRNSLESIPFNMAVSAPQDEDDQNDSSGDDSHCFELKKPNATNLKSQENKVAENHIDILGKLDNVNSTKIAPDEKTKGLSPSSLQVKFEEQMAQAMSANESKNRVDDMGQRNISISKKPEIVEAIEDGSSNTKNKANETSALSSNFVIDKSIRSHYMSENVNMPPEDDHRHDSIWRSQPSPVRQWADKLPPHDHETESSSRLPQDLKENTLKAKLIEARSRGQRSRSRLKGTKISL